YIGGAQAGIWKSTNAVASPASSVAWAPVTDNQATLSIGAIAIQPGNNDSSQSVILAATGEANNSSDSYFGLGILRSDDAGNSWTLIPASNNGALSFSGLGATGINQGVIGPRLASILRGVEATHCARRDRADGNSFRTGGHRGDGNVGLSGGCSEGDA